MRRMNYKSRRTYTSKPLERLSTDVCTVNEVSICGSTMFQVIMDEHTRFKWCFLLTTKSEASQHVSKIIKQLQVQVGDKYKIQELHSDQGGEYLSSELRVFCDENGIVQRYTNAYSPEENGIVERANGVVLTKVRALLMATGLPNALWGEALLNVIDTDNQVVVATTGMSPIKALYGRDTDIRDLRAWGCVCYAHKSNNSRHTKTN